MTAANGPQNIFIAGASARAAACSALRAGLRPACADLFADADLRAICQVEKIANSEYPTDIIASSAKFPPGPWLYTGALENRPDVIRAISSKRPLWGCSPEAVEKARDPGTMHTFLGEWGMFRPKVLLAGTRWTGQGRWLLKPIAGAAGLGIREVEPSRLRLVPQGCYGQEFVDGTSCSGLFVGHERGCLFLGSTIQLIGTPWLHATGFHYAGSVGLVDLPPATVQCLRDLGNFLAYELGLRGVFGVDFVLEGKIPWVIEINPRYTASVEIWEYARKRSALALHRRVFEKMHDVADQKKLQVMRSVIHSKKVIGKAILYARETVTIPAPTPWSTAKAADPTSFDPPEFADLPSAGDLIERGHPILTLFATGSDVPDCLQQLEERANSLDRFLFGTRATNG